MAQFNINTINSTNSAFGEIINFDSSGQRVIYNNNLLHLVGNLQFGEVDEPSLRRSGLILTRIDTKEKFIFYYNQSLINNNLLKLLHFSGHSNESALMFTDGTLRLEDFREFAVDSFDVVVLASCESFKFVDAFSGISKKTVGFLNQIESEQAALLTEMFWKNVLKSDVDEAITIIRKNSSLGKFVYVT